VEVDPLGRPARSSSNCFRTRAALIDGVSDWIIDQERRPVSTAFVPRSVDELVDSMCALLEVTTHRNRDVTTARLVLFLEANHDAGLRETLSRGRATLTEGIVSAFADLGARDPRAAAEAVVACFEGLILHRIARHDDTDPRPVFDTVVRGALA
jgi:hypothetical protein